MATGTPNQRAGQPAQREQRADARAGQHCVQRLIDGERPAHEQFLRQ